MQLSSDRIDLVVATVESLYAAIAGNAALATRLNAQVTIDWPPEHLDADALRWVLAAADLDPRIVHGWGMWFVLLRAASASARTLVGNVGFKGPPDADGRVECGYSIIASHQRRGLATEAMRALGDWAFTHPDVQSIAAETYPHLAGSLGVMRRLGMKPVGAGAQPGVVRHAVTRQAWRGQWTT